MQAVENKQGARDGDAVHLVKSVYPFDDFTTRIKTAAKAGTLL